MAASIHRAAIVKAHVLQSVTELPTGMARDVAGDLRDAARLCAGMIGDEKGHPETGHGQGEGHPADGSSLRFERALLGIRLARHVAPPFVVSDRALTGSPPKVAGLAAGICEWPNAFGGRASD